MSAKPTALGGSKPLLAGSAVGIPQSTVSGYSTNYLPGTSTFTPPTPGRYKFSCSGAGSNNSNVSGGASGSYGEITRSLTPGQPVSVAVGSDGGIDTKLTFSDGLVCTAGNASGTTPGVATGFDVNLGGSPSGSAGAGTGGGASGGAGQGGGAPANLPRRAGPGGGSGIIGRTPGGGSGTVASVAQGGDGEVIITLVG